MTDKAPLELDQTLLDACIHCGMCLPTCPTYRVTGSEAESPRGRLYLMKKMTAGDLDQPGQLSTHLNACLGCQACESACPSGVKYGSLLFQARRELKRSERPSPGRGLKRWVFRNVLPNRNLLNLMGAGLRFYQKSGIQALTRQSHVLNLFPGLANSEALLPRVPQSRPLATGMSFGNPDGERVALMTGCVMDTFYNPVHWATIDVLTANNYCVVIPEQTCCGALALHAGEEDIARDLARKNLQGVLKMNPQWIVLNSAGCGAVLKEYGHLLADEPLHKMKANEFSAKVVDILELLAKKPLAPMRHPLDRTATYHAACHLHHAQGVKTQPQQVLSQIPGVKWVPLKEFDACCGSAGIYNLEQPELSGEILDMKTTNLRTTGADLVVTGNPGCLLQIENGLRGEGIAMEVLHPVQLMAQAYGKSGGVDA